MNVNEGGKGAASPGAATADGGNAHLEYLCVDDFIRTVVDARAVKTAFELGLIDHLLRVRSSGSAALERVLGVDRHGLQFLLALLRANRVVDVRGTTVTLQRGFLAALHYRDLLETKLDFADYFTALVKDPARFMGQGRLYELFDYRRCFEPTIENYQRTRVWMRLTSALTRYEAQACMRLHDFSGYRRMLDVGGNSGEFALQLCRVNPALRTVVLDLPLVCEIGLEHVLGEPEHPRITFVKSDIRNNPLPQGCDLIAFKSMLHDWQEADARRFVAKAMQALNPGGTLLIFERGPLEVADAAPPFSMLPILLFFRSYRSPSVYLGLLEELGFSDARCREIKLDTPFFLVTANKPPSA